MHEAKSCSRGTRSEIRARLFLSARRGEAKSKGNRKHMEKLFLSGSAKRLTSLGLLEQGNDSLSAEVHEARDSARGVRKESSAGSSVGIAGTGGREGLSASSVARGFSTGIGGAGGREGLSASSCARSFSTGIGGTCRRGGGGNLGLGGGGDVDRAGGGHDGCGGIDVSMNASKKNVLCIIFP